MSNLFDKKCVPCEGGVPPLDLKEIHKYQTKVDGWDVKPNEKKIHQDSFNKLKKEIKKRFPKLKVELNVIALDSKITKF